MASLEASVAPLPGEAGEEGRRGDEAGRGRGRKGMRSAGRHVNPYLCVHSLLFMRAVNPCCSSPVNRNSRTSERPPFRRTRHRRRSASVRSQHPRSTPPPLLPAPCASMRHQRAIPVHVTVTERRECSRYAQRGGISRRSTRSTGASAVPLVDCFVSSWVAIVLLLLALSAFSVASMRLPPGSGSPRRA